MYTRSGDITSLHHSPTKNANYLAEERERRIEKHRMKELEAKLDRIRSEDDVTSLLIE